MFFIILLQKPPHMDSSGGVGGSRWLSCILISTCFCILLALVDKRSGADSKVCQYKWSNQGALAYSSSYTCKISSFNKFSLEAKFIHCYGHKLLLVSIVGPRYVCVWCARWHRMAMLCNTCCVFILHHVLYILHLHVLHRCNEPSMNRRVECKYSVIHQGNIWYNIVTTLIKSTITYFGQLRLCISLRTVL